MPMRIIILLITILLPSVLQADIFTPSPTDKSVDLLGYIFGPAVGSVQLHGIANPALVHMFQRFNTAIITVGTMIISYIAIISTINTAQEGQVMGRKWNSVWIPIRSLLGMLLLVPAPSSGFSIVQTAIMWCIMQGIGAADSIWNGILKDLSNGLSATQGLIRTSNDTQSARVYDALELVGADMAENLLRSAVCMETIHKMHQQTANQPLGGFKTPEQSNVRSYGGLIHAFETTNSNNLSNHDLAEFSGTWRIGMQTNPEFSEICGKYQVKGIAKRSEWSNPNTISDKTISDRAREIYDHKVLALQLILQYFHPLATQIVDEVIIPRNENNRIAALDNDPVQPGGYRSQAIKTYREILKHQVKPQRIDSLDSIIREGRDNGWLSAGSFYFTLNQTHPVNFFEDIVVPPTVNSIPRCDELGLCSNYSPDQINILPVPLRNFLQYGPEISYMGTRLWDSKIYLENDFTTVSEQLNLTRKDAKIKPLHELQGNMLNLLREMMSEQHSDPLIAQGRFGSSIMILSERSWLDTQNELHTTLNRAEQGYLPINKELMQKIQNLTHRGAMSVAIYSIVWVIGAILAIYIPLIPYLIFTIGVIGWLLLVIEATVAAPILAISFMLPANEELGKMLHGLSLLLNIVLRPVLMLFGFVLASRLYQVAVKLVNFGIITNFDTLNTTDSLFAWVAILALYATFIIALSNKCFSLIYALPDKVLRWMGGIPEQTDPSNEMQTAKSGFLKGADTVNKISIGMPERSFARLQARSKQLGPPDAVSS